MNSYRGSFQGSLTHKEFHIVIPGRSKFVSLAVPRARVQLGQTKPHQRSKGLLTKVVYGLVADYRSQFLAQDLGENSCFFALFVPCRPLHLKRPSRPLQERYISFAE